jgi:dTDP-glucose pyrophosphorylase
VLDTLVPLVEGGAGLVCLVREEEDRRYHTSDVVRLLVPGATVHVVPELPSAACAALHAIDLVDPEESLLVVNGDQVVDVDLREVIAGFEREGLDGGVVVFDAVHPRWSYVRCDEDGLVVEAAEKRPISRNATAGTYWFRRAGDLFESIMAMILKDASVEGRYYVCPAYNEMVLRGARIGVHPVGATDYHSLATPRGVEAYEHVLAERRTGSTG